MAKRSVYLEKASYYFEFKVYLDHTSPNRGSKGNGICGRGMSRLVKRLVVTVNGQ